MPDSKNLNLATRTRNSKNSQRMNPALFFICPRCKTTVLTNSRSMFAILKCSSTIWIISQKVVSSIVPTNGKAWLFTCISRKRSFNKGRFSLILSQRWTYLKNDESWNFQTYISSIFHYLLQLPVFKIVFAYFFDYRFVIFLPLCEHAAVFDKYSFVLFERTSLWN
jgi:hypothetical protein